MWTWSVGNGGRQNEDGVMLGEMRQAGSSGIVKGNKQPSALLVLQRSDDPQQAESSSSLNQPADTLSPVSPDSALPEGQTNTSILLGAEALQQPLYRACLLKKPDALMSG